MCYLHPVMEIRQVSLDQLVREEAFCFLLCRFPIDRPVSLTRSDLRLINISEHSTQVEH